MIRLKWNAIFEITTGETFKGYDVTGLYDATLNPGGYGAPNIEMSDVHATRMIYESYLKDQAATTSTGIVSSVEYLVGGSGSFTYDTKTYSAGDTFISMLDGTPTLSNCTLTQTGRYCPVIDFVPSNITTSDFTPSLLGIDSTIFPDSTYSVQYEIYDTVWSAGSVTVSGDTQYIVIGSSGSIVTIAGVSYRVGEVLNKSSNFSFTATGTGQLVEFYATTVDDNDNPTYTYFLLAYNAYQAIKELELKVASSSCQCKNKANEKLQTCYVSWQAILDNFEGNLGLDISGTQILLDEIISITSNACNCS